MEKEEKSQTTKSESSPYLRNYVARGFSTSPYIEFAEGQKDWSVITNQERGQNCPINYYKYSASLLAATLITIP